MLQIIISNILGYDAIIIVMGILTLLFVIPIIWKTSSDLEEALNPTISMSITEIIKVIYPSNDRVLDLQKCKKQKDKANLHYNIFVSITNIFPLLGILGTLISLLSLVDFSASIVEMQFTKALTSTVWGLVWAIFFKSLEGIIYSKIQRNEESLNMIFQRIDQYQLEKGSDLSCIENLL